MLAANFGDRAGIFWHHAAIVLLRTVSELTQLLQCSISELELNWVGRRMRMTLISNNLASGSCP